MSRVHRTPALAVLSLVVACGGPRGPAEQHTETPLGPRIAIPGTGVSLEAPRGAELVPVGPGVFVADAEITIMASVVLGGVAERDAVARSFALDRTEGRHRPVVVSGVSAELGRDIARTGPAARPRVWLLASRDGRVLTIMATFADGEDARAEALVERSLETVQWDRALELDPALAIGLALGDAEGLSFDRTTVGTLALVPPEARFPPPEGEPFVLLLPLPHPVPDAPNRVRCAEILADTRVLATPTDDVVPFEESGRWGCEAEGEHVTSTGTHLYAYTSLVVLDVGPFLVTGMVSPERREEWGPRFRAAARGLRWLRRG